MPNTTKGYPYPEGSDAVDVPGDLQALADAVDASPGVTSYTSTQIAALTAGEKWAGRVIWNSTSGKLQVSNGSTFTDVDTSVALSSSTPQTLGTAAAGTSSDASRADHRHAMPSASDVGAVANALVSNTKGAVPVGTGSAVAALSPGSNGQIPMADSGATNGLRYVDPPANRNLLVNGSMQVHQRGTIVTGITTFGYRTADRWQFTGDFTGTWTNSVETDAPAGSGFNKSLKLLVTTASTSPPAGTYVVLNQSIEGQNLQQLAKGTSAARQVTLSFWVKSNVTGTFVVEIEDSGNSRGVSASYSVTSANTWERKTITFPADTTGTIANTNAAGLNVNFALVAGSSFSSGTLQTTWSSLTTANRAVGQTNLAAATNNYWQITGVQLETGPVATPFEFEPYEATLRKCQRYYYRNTTGANGFADVTAFGSAASTTSAQVPVIHPVTMRVAPTAVAYSALKWRDSAANSVAITAATVYSATPSVTIVAATSSSLTANRPVALCGDNSTTAHISLDAEL